MADGENTKLQIIIEANADKVVAACEKANVSVAAMSQGAQRSLDAFIAKIEPVAGALNKMNKEVAQADGLLKAGRITTEQHATAISLAKKAYEEFGKSGSTALTLNRNQLMELQHVGRSAFDSLAAGASPFRVLSMEGGRLAQVMGEGKGGVGGTLGAIAGLVNPAVLVIGALTAAMAAGAISAVQYEKQMEEIQTAIAGLGRGSGVTMTQLLALADAQAKAGDISVGSARKLDEAMITTGAVTSSSLKSAADVVTEFASVTHSKLDDATKVMAAAFKDPAAGAEELGKSYGLLSQAEADHIKKIEEQQGKSAALIELIHVLKGELDKVPDALRAQASGWDILANKIANAWDQLGHFIAQMLQMEKLGPQARLSNLQEQRRVAGDQSARSSNYGFDNSAQVASLDKQIAATKAEIAKNDASTKSIAATARKNEDSFRPKAPKTPKAAKGPADQTASLDATAQSAMDGALKQYVQAMLALTSGIQARADAEKDVVDADLDTKLDALTKDEIKIKASKNDAHKTEQLAIIASAKAKEQDAADAKKELIDRQTAISLDQQQEQAAHAAFAFVLQETELRGQLARTAAERLKLELEALAERKADEDTAREHKRDQDLLAAGDNEAERTRINNNYGVEQAGADRVNALQVKQTTHANLSPLQAWADQGVKSAAEVQEAFEKIEVEGIESLNQGLGDSIVNAKNFGDVLTSAAKQAEAAVIQLLLKMAETQAFGGSGGGGFNLLSLFGGGSSGGSSGGVGSDFVPGLLSAIAGVPIPGFATGTDSTPGGLTRYDEKGVEGYVPPGAQIIPNDTLRGLAQLAPALLSGRMGAGAQPISVSIIHNIDATGADPAAIARLQAGLVQTNASLEQRAVAAVRQAQSRQLGR